MSRGHVFEICRVTVEFTSPMLVGTGRASDLVDTQFAVDANGLPVLPGTSIAGVLRHALPMELRDKVFGFQRGAEGAASPVEVSFGHVHDSQDRPVPFFGAKLEDPVLQALQAGVVRDHVCLNSRGVVDARGKFDTFMVPTGARFTFELVVRQGCPVKAQDLVNYLAADSLMLGGLTRRGLGRFKVVRAAARTFDLAADKDFTDFTTRLPSKLHEAVPAGVLTSLSPAATPAGDVVHGLVTLAPESWWMFGGGEPSADRADHRQPGSDRVSDRVNAHEAKILWATEKGVTRGSVLAGDKAPLVAPATGLKGALRHRMAFHARRSAGRWADDAPQHLPGPEAEEAVCELFGIISNQDDNGRQQTGHPGRVFIDDAIITGDKPGWQQHVSLDRFTQGPMSGLLFDEAPRHGGTLTYRVVVHTRGLSDDARRALKAALDDLCEGRLAFGAMSSRGYGYASAGQYDGTLKTWLEGR